MAKRKNKGRSERSPDERAAGGNVFKVARAQVDFAAISARHLENAKRKQYPTAIRPGVLQSVATQEARPRKQDRERPVSPLAQQAVRPEQNRLKRDAPTCIKRPDGRKKRGSGGARAFVPFCGA